MDFIKKEVFFLLVLFYSISSYGFERLNNSILIETGRVEFDNTIRFLSFDIADANSFWVVENIKLGVPYELNIGFKPVYEFSNRFNDGISEIEISLYKRIFDEKFRTPGLNLKGFLKFGGKEGVYTTTSEEDFGILVHLHKKLERDLNLGLELGATFRGDKPGKRIDTSFDYCLGLEKKLNKNLDFSGELYGNTSIYDTGVSIISLGGGLNYRLTDAFKLKSFIGLGLNKRAPEVDSSLTLTLGVTPEMVKNPVAELDRLLVGPDDPVYIERYRR
ncbi:MAG: hypothetical protein AB1765_13395, partial [Candidatus Hydrogenedentota bacterium]